MIPVNASKMPSRSWITYSTSSISSYMHTVSMTLSTTNDE